MDINYDVFLDHENSSDVKNSRVSGYQPEHFASAVGTGSNSSLVTAVCSDQSWPVSQLTVKFKRINEDIRESDSAGSLVNVTNMPNDKLNLPILTTKEKLDQVREIFGLSISHLAEVFRVSRPTLHSWLDGIEPRDSSIERIKQVYDFSQSWKNKSTFHYPPGKLMRQSLGNAPSMHMSLSQDKLIPGEINEGFNKLLELMERQQSQMDQAIKRSQDSTLSQKDKHKNRHSLTNTIYLE